MSSRNDTQKAQPSRARDGDDAEAAAHWVPIGDIYQWSGNPRKHTNEEIKRTAESIKRFGFGSPIVARPTGEIIAGHRRFKAAHLLGLDRVPVRYMDLDPADAHLLALLDNRHTEETEWDTPRLANELSEFSLPDVELAGWSSDDLDKMASELGANDSGEGDEDEQEPPEPPAEPVTKPGDVWMLGDHVLVCGDCRNGAIAEVMGADRANLVFTSPPYASQRRYDESSGFKPIPPEKYVDWWEDVQGAVRDVLAEDGSFFVNIKEHAEGLDRSLYVFDLVIAMVRRWGWHFAEQFYWERIGVPGKPARRFRQQCEPIYQFALGEWKFRPESVRHESDEVPTYDKGNVLAHGTTDTSQGAGKGTSWANNPGAGKAYPGNRLPPFKTNSDHPAAFPVKLADFFVRAYTDDGDVVLDPFAGSGSTLIACERNARRGRMIEISPAYCDVIVERWQNETGGQAQRSRAA